MSRRRFWPRMKNFLLQLGEQDGIGATATMIVKDKKRIVIEHGIGFSKNGEIKINNRPAGDYLVGTRIDLIILTHRHYDHIGAMARFIALHPEAEVVMSYEVHQLGIIVLEDSYKIQQGERRKAEMTGLSLPEEIVSLEDIDIFKKLPNEGGTIIKGNAWLDSHPKWIGWKLGFHHSGHDTGSLMVFIKTPSGDRIVYTSDVASHDQKIVKGVMMPDQEFIGDFFTGDGKTIMITEATNGNRPMVEIPERVEARMIAVTKTVIQRGGIALYPSFAGNRCANNVWSLCEAGILTVLDGLACDFVRIEIPGTLVDQWVKEGKLIIVKGPDRKLSRELREKIVRGDFGPCAIVTSSATMEKGHAPWYGSKLLDNPLNALIFTGHMFEDSIGEQIRTDALVERGRTIKLEIFVGQGRDSRLEKVPVNVRCDVYHFDRTSHDKQGGLVERIRLVRPDHLIVHHCKKDGYEGLMNAVIASPHIKTPRISRATHLTPIEL